MKHNNPNCPNIEIGSGNCSQCHPLLDKTTQFWKDETIKYGNATKNKKADCSEIAHYFAEDSKICECRIKTRYSD